MRKDGPRTPETGADGVITPKTKHPASNPVANVICVEIAGDRVER